LTAVAGCFIAAGMSRISNRNPARTWFMVFPDFSQWIAGNLDQLLVAHDLHKLDALYVAAARLALPQASTL
jgi:hypothetical protein